jgi:hypothetical protein
MPLIFEGNRAPAPRAHLALLKTVARAHHWSDELPFSGSDLPPPIFRTRSHTLDLALPGPAWPYIMRQLAKVAHAFAGVRSGLRVNSKIETLSKLT